MPTPVIILECPNCHHRGELKKDFGLRNMPNGKVYSQPWCRTCRAEAAKKSQEKKK